MDFKSKLADYCCHEQQPRKNEHQVSTKPQPIPPSQVDNKGTYIEARVPLIKYILHNVPTPYHASPPPPPVDPDSSLVKTVQSILQIQLPVIRLLKL
jgi:hypothetical protein